MSSSSYLAKSACRSLITHPDEEAHGFLVGTANLRGPNEIRLLRYHDEDDDIECVASYAHPGEVLSMSACPEDSSMLVSVAGSVSGSAALLSATVWKMEDLPGASGADDRYGHDGVRGSSSAAPRELKKIASVPSSGGGMRAMHAHWLPRAASSGATDASIVCVDETSVKVMRLREGAGELESVVTSEMEDVSYVGGIAWDALHPAEMAVAVDHTVQCWDLRTGDRTRQIGRAVAPGSCVRSISYNINKPWHLVSGGDDFRVKVWDLRRADTPVKVLDGHTHWVTSVAVNAFHDQLILSGGSDARVNLWRVSSVSSAPLLELGEDDMTEGSTKKNEPKLAPDICIRGHEDHDDSVCGVAWSAHTAWVYASLSHSGKLVVSQVPSHEKYKILL